MPKAANGDKASKRSQDAEIAAMGKLWRIVDELDEPAAGRVLLWLNKRYQEKTMTESPGEG
jgi:hypothetical protein